MYDEVDLDELIDIYESSKGYALRRFINDSTYLIKIHDTNFHEIVSLINEYEKLTSTDYPQSKAKKVDIGRVASQKFLAKFLQLLHNYCASSYTIEQQYTEFLTAKRYHGLAYNQKVGEVFKELEDNPKHLFFFAIRNYFTHMSIPDIQTGIQHKRIEADEIGSLRFITRGRFTIAKRFFTSDIEKKLWDETNGYRSRLITNSNKLKLLNHFIRHVAGSRLNIEIKDILYEYQSEVHVHVNKINEALIENEKDAFEESVGLIEAIKRRQDAIRSD